MSLINILNIVRSLDQEPDQLSEDEEANLFVYLTGNNDTTLAEVENLCNHFQTNSAKLKYLRWLSLKTKSESGMFIRFVFSVIFANNTEYLLILVIVKPAPKNLFSLL